MKKIISLYYNKYKLTKFQLINILIVNEYIFLYYNLLFKRFKFLWHESNYLHVVIN
jgi:hypothetical protein